MTDVTKKPFCPIFRILETFEAFSDLEEIDENNFTQVENCLKDLLPMNVSHGIALWKLAMQIKKGITINESE